MRAAAHLLSALLAAALAAALAHGGEDHGAIPPPASSDGTDRTAATSSDELELVVRWPAREASDEPLPLRVLVSDWATNTPVEGARVELTLTGPAEVKVEAKPTNSPGVYEAAAKLPKPGTYAAAATVLAGEVADALALTGLEIGPPPPAVVAEDEHDHGPPLGWIVAGGLVAGLGITVLLQRRKRRAEGAIAALALALVPAGALAHGGEDHGAPAGAAVAAAPGAPVHLAKESQFLLGIRTKPVEARAVVDRLRVSGRVVAPPEGHAPIYAPQPGRLVAPPGGFRRLGAQVRKGEVLGVIEAALSAGERASFSVEAAQAGGRTEAAAAKLEAARRSLERLRGLAGVTSQAELEAAEVEVRTAEAELGAARAQQRAYGGEGGSTRFTLVAPLDGVLADVGASPGEVVDPSTRLFLVVDPRELWVEAAVYEGDVAKVEDAARALVSVEAYRGVTFRGERLAVGQVVDPATRTVKAVFRVENPDRKLKVGMFAEVEIEAGDGDRALVVDEAAVLDLEGRRVVYVHTAPETFEAREVALGRKDGPVYEVRAGLSKGDRAVVVGAYSLKNAPAARN